MRSRGFRGAALGAVTVSAAVFASGCGGLTHTDANVVNGKTLFVAKCGACHVLSRAGTKGITGPSLDQAFARARLDGFGETTFKGLVHRQIGQPNKNAQVDPATGKVLPKMPANLVTGQDASDVAAYVASAAAVPGKDAGALAQVGAASAKGATAAKGGKLDMPADPGGALAYKFASATAPAGGLTVD